jgi:signal transduction histidine kinase
MVEDFLSISRIEQGRMKYDFSSTDIRNLIATIIQEQMPSVSRAGLTISFNCDENNSYFASVDPGKMRQVITNLIDNSIKYTPKGSILITLTKDSNKKELVISIKDTGVGIDKETLPQLFEKFSRAKEASRVNVLGTGLGLYLAREIVHAHSGKIWVESKGKGEGSTFYVKISSDTSAEHSKQINEFANSI